MFIEKIVVTEFNEHSGRLRGGEEVPCSGMEEVKRTLLSMKGEEVPFAEISYLLNFPLGLTVALREEVLLTSGERLGTVPAGKDYNWADGKLVFSLTPEGTPYLCLGGLADKSYYLLERGACWIYQGNPAKVALYFWLQRRKYFPLCRKIPWLILRSEKRVLEVLDQTLNASAYF